MEDEILKIRDLYKSFNNQKPIETEGPKALFSGLNLSVPKGHITALVGGNGTGKTTLFNIISGFVHADTGDINYIFDTEVRLNDIEAHERNGLGIGRLFQTNHIFSSLTSLENLLVADRDFRDFNLWELIIHRKRNIRANKERISKAIGLAAHLLGENHQIFKKLHDYPSNLSFGQKRILSLLSLMMSDYRLVLLDEPTAGLNPASKKLISKIMNTMRSNGTTVFMIEHNIKYVKAVADYCAFLDDGKIALSGSPDFVLRNDFVQKYYIIK